MTMLRVYDIRVVHTVVPVALPRTGTRALAGRWNGAHAGDEEREPR